MKKLNVIIITIIILFLFSNISVAQGEKTILIMLDELKFNTIEKITQGIDFGAGFINIKTRNPQGNESLYFSIATGRKVGVKKEYYKGLYRAPEGYIIISGFDDMLKNLNTLTANVENCLLGEKLKDVGISYIGDNSAAIIAADKNGIIERGEVEVVYEKKWLIDKANYHLSSSNILVLSLQLENRDERIQLLKEFVNEYRNYNILIVPKDVSKSVNYMMNKTIVPIVYINEKTNGIINSLSTKRDGFIALEDIYGELLSIYGRQHVSIIGNNINITEEKDNIEYIKNLFNKSINLMLLTYLFHGIVYSVQVYTAYHIYKNRSDKLETIKFITNFTIINIFIGLLMGLSNLHVNFVLYFIVNLLTTYAITLFVTEKGVNIIGLFAALTYGIILYGIFFSPELIYNSYIGFNNLFYGARYYGFNNGIMGVLLVCSIISCHFIMELINKKPINDLICFLFQLTNMVALSARYGANTGGFLTALILFLMTSYFRFFKGQWHIKKLITLVVIAIIIFSINMYLDYYSNEKSHAINFFIRIRNNGVRELVDMLIIKAKELAKLTILPPFSITIISQIITLKSLFTNAKNLEKETYTILITSIVGFMLNDTGNITFIYMIHYLVSFIIQHEEIPSGS
ncbi:hypothetical protein [Tepidimicrobium xylanilyticum]|uniref:hypothetical protein n=1 Tax=Tepidimicrobium xylanilyticum TaxID=1123352 RepID=UPI002652CFA4|nr:hypothetical protein [Tepidimicrobium xylanilyticum]GMG95878.1 membrane protein [Tepidimicrobium xylanilyticum]